MANHPQMKVIVGGGEFDRENNPGWLSTQASELNLLRPTDWEKRFAPGSLDAVLAEHVWEHLTVEEGRQGAKTVFRFLKPGGHLRCAVPDGFFPDEAYQRMIQVGGSGPADHPAATHRVVYNYRTFPPVFEKKGFQVQLLEYHDEEGRFHFTDWDPVQGLIYRSLRFDHRNRDGENRFLSLILDAVKPAE